MRKFLSIICLLITGLIGWQGKTGNLITRAIPEAVIQKDTGKIYTIYFTIDDGPLEGAPFIDSVFREEKVPASLFLVGSHVYQDSIFEVYLKVLKANHWFEMFNHSYTHANEDYAFYYSHPKIVFHDMRRNEDSLHFKTRICRMPARNTWRIAGKRSNDPFGGNRAANLLKRKGYTVIGWDLEWESDSLNQPVQSPDNLFNELKNSFEQNRSFVPGHVVLLCHDWMFINHAFMEELDAFIKLVKSAGNIRFEWLKNYPLYKKK